MTARRIVPSINEVDNYWHSISKGVLLVGKIIVRVKKGVYDIALLSHVNDNKFNNMSLFDVRRFSANKETYLIKIHNNSHPYPDITREDALPDRNDQGV